MENLIFRKLDPAQATPDLMDRFASCYQEVFAASPWSEWLKCPVCGISYGNESRLDVEKANYLHCGQKLKEHWPKHEVIISLTKNVDKNGSCWLAEDNGKVVGFCYAYVLTQQPFEDKFSISIDINPIGGPKSSFIYQDEMGVLAEYRNRKLAKILNKLTLTDLTHQGCTGVVAIARRKPIPSVTYGWLTQKLGYKIIAEYPSQDGRVVLGRLIKEVPSLTS